MSAREVAERLYDGLQRADAATLVEVLHPEFTGHVSEGMPLGVGGPVDSGKQMLVGVWGRVASELHTAPFPEEYVEVGPDRILVLGHYRGTARRTGRAYEALFVHDLRFRDDRVVRLVQVTDTHRWHAALDGSAG